ncbi:membrane protein [Dissulfurispira thermophila]|uniref:Membrane protein n=2 Tax=root TaxID=1 RepID=A0A7G1H2X2_9BACT|nr:SDR family NAD(P)-dependent oxidoreductase [Dissulfurispira thermophila]BCB96067.1 membrane protein [Dissulfurispira thermophila]
MQSFSNEGIKCILITGGAGTVGKTLIRQLLLSDIQEIRIFDNNETELFYLTDEYRGESRVVFFLGDVRDRDKLIKITRGVDVIFHTAAFKHVILSEFNPFDVVQTNINGTQNIIEAALTNNVGKVIFTSSDKAVNPTNVMGTSKLMAEKLITAANTIRYDKKTIFSSTRFGNVLGSRGSVVPIFKKQIKNGGPVTLTDNRMTRFVMTVDEAVGLVVESSLIARGGEVFVTKMPVIRISDLADVMIDILAPMYGYKPDSIKIIEIGKKPGEKLYEELMSHEEMGRAIELKKLFVIFPAFRDLYKIDYTYKDIVSYALENPYISSDEPYMSKEELRAYILKHRLVEEVC